MITISLCMIVKDEEAVLKRCLDSICGLMDEIIIVDTGSTDRTKEIAGQYTDKIYDFTWVHDFSAARNFSFSKASGDYIYAADADEVLDEKNRELFLDLKQHMSTDIEIVQMLYCNQLEYNTTYNFDEEYRPKLFKRLRTFTWIEPIHEGVRLEPVTFDSEIRISHRPVGNHGGRDFETFQRLVKKGTRLSKKLHGMYARELYITGTDTDFLESEKFFQASIMDPERSLDEIKEAACVLTRTGRIKKDVHQILKYASKNLALDAPAELCYELGEYYKENCDLDEAVIWYYNAAYETVSILNIQYSKKLPLSRLAECYEAMGILEQAERYKKLAMEED